MNELIALFQIINFNFFFKFFNKNLICIVEKRTLKIVDELIEKANINKNDLIPIIQNIYLGNTLAADDLKVLEVEDEMLNKLLDGDW
jgi:hypothetical protein